MPGCRLPAGFGCGGGSSRLTVAAFNFPLICFSFRQSAPSTLTAESALGSANTSASAPPIACLSCSLSAGKVLPANGNIGVLAIRKKRSAGNQLRALRGVGCIADHFGDCVAHV